MSDEITIEVNGVPLKARKGQMIMQVTDPAGIYIPRFCYHEKLSVAANCRMCLVEVEKAPKPLPACATPVADGMKVFTRSPKAISAQKATMEFLLINHPLDCPICDQGGECELQDLAMGFGRDLSRFTERKRVVKDKNLGPLISTDMTRCIHCTRCVRFGEEIAGIQELGTTGRGEHMEIGTYIERSVDHELSGNVIDLCPVGALNSKPYRYQARSWEMIQQATVAPHDCAGSNIYAHVLRGKLMRVVPRPNESINETWISDRDRFSYEGVYSEDRLQRPMMKVDGAWEQCDWEVALQAAGEGLRKIVELHGAEQLGALISPSATLEELYLLARFTRGLGSNNIDHRLRRQDFRDQEHDPVFPWLGLRIPDLEKQRAMLVVGSNLRAEVPILAHRVRKAALAGSQVMLLNQSAYDYLFPVSESLTAKPGAMVAALAGIVKAAAEEAQKPMPENVAPLVSVASVQSQHRAIAKNLIEAEPGLIVLGQIAMGHAAFSELRALANALADLCHGHLGFIPDGANAAGACLAGALPHRRLGGRPVEKPGLTVKEMLKRELAGYILFGVEPEFDCGNAAGALSALDGAEYVIALTPFVTRTTMDYADLLLPIGTFAETSGTFVNAEGTSQSFSGLVKPVHEARPGWKVLRVLGNLAGLEGFEYLSSEDVKKELLAALGEVQTNNRRVAAALPGAVDGDAQDVHETSLYAIDAVVRRAPALQKTRQAKLAAAG